MIKVLIIEDELSILKMLSYDLKQLGYHVDAEQDGLKGYQKAKTGDYDVILLDLMLPSMNGIDICKRLRDNEVNAYIIMLTAMDEEYQKIEGFDVGADDYVTKPFSPRELTARVKAATRRQGKKERPKEALDYHDVTMDLRSYEVRINGVKTPFTLKEFELLEYLIINQGKALSREQLLSTLWGYSYDGDSRVVDVHIFKLRDKTQTLHENIQTVRGVGYKLV